MTGIEKLLVRWGAARLRRKQQLSRTNVQNLARVEEEMAMLALELARRELREAADVAIDVQVVLESQ